MSRRISGFAHALTVAFPFASVFVFPTISLTAPPTIVYDASNLSTGAIGNGTLPIGQAVTLAGSDREVTNFEVGLGSDGAATFTASFRLLDGPGATPGTVIWTSPLQTFPYVPPFYNDKLLSVAVPNIVVPDTFVWTVSIVQLYNNVVVQSTSSPTIGTAGKAWYFNFTDQQWTSEPNVFAARITVVPEPATLTLLALGVVGLAVMRRRR
jgi:PEP-CTERM motif